ncbi:MAG: alpha/beta fold hydrolase [Pelobium sp.]
MTHHYFDHALASLSYYKFGKGEKVMLCFHGYGMHGKQFKILEEQLGEKYTFYGLDLFFHKETKLKNESLEAVKTGISKKELVAFIIDFCEHVKINKFSLLSYSMGTHYATAIAEEIPEKVEEFIAVAPSILNPGRLVTFFSQRKSGNKILERLVLSEKALVSMLKWSRKFKFVDDIGYQILMKEIGTKELRFSFYACFIYLRFLAIDETRLLEALNEHPIKSVFIFGKRDLMYPPKIGDSFLAKLKDAKVLVLDENHEIINQNFALALTEILI